MAAGRRPGRRIDWVRRLGSVAIVAIACWLAGGVAQASTASMPAEGVFEGCPLDKAMETCMQRLQVMHQGGVQVVVTGVGGASLNSLSTYAAAANALGMSVMWEISNQGWWQSPTTGTDMAGYFPAFATACGCSQNGAVLAYLVQWLGALPGTYGYYAADDSMLAPGDQAGMAGYVAQIKQQDPVHPVMISGFDPSQGQAYEGTADMIGQEIYPVMGSPLLPAASNQSAWNSVAQTASDSQRLADGANKPSAFILQAFTWGDNLDDGIATGVCSSSDSKADCYARLRYPSPDEQLQLRNTVLEHARPKLILWWSFPGTYGDASGDTYSIYPTGAEAAARWSGLSAAIQAPAPVPSTGQPPPAAATPAPATGKPAAAKVSPARVARKHKHSRHRRHERRRHRRLRRGHRRHRRG